MTIRITAAAAAALFASGCIHLQGRDGADGADGPDHAAAPQYSAEILRDAYGVPRVVAPDWAGLGYGSGYAAAQDNLCLIAERAITVRGERAAFLGAGENDANIASDLFHRARADEATITAILNGPAGSIDTPSETARDYIAGFAAGVNRVIAEGGTNDPACAGADWVRPVSETDIWLGALTLPFGNPIEAIAAARPPEGGMASLSEARVEDMLAERDGMGSNAYAIGRDATRGQARAVLLGNPHYPWNGALRFYRIGLTIPGEVDVVGAGLITTPFVGIGHTETIAWTHTVSTARRFGYFELTLDPEDPTRYRVGDEWRDMTERRFEIEVAGGEPVTRSVYATEFGPVIATERLPWTAERAYAFAAPSSGLRIIDQYIAIYAAQDVPELHGALARYQATAFNTMAVDSGGLAFYGDMGLVPNVSAELAEACSASETAMGFWAAARIPVLDASNPDCRWADADDAVQPGVFGPSGAPHLIRTDYIAQSNDSPWLTNPESPITGLSPIWGDEATPRSLRTRLALDQIRDRLSGADGLGEPGFDIGTVQAIMYANRHYGGELLRDDAVTACRAAGAPELEPLCAAFEGWDLKANRDSTGAHAFSLFLLNGGAGALTGDFDPARAIDTPTALDASSPAVLDALRTTAGQLAALQIAPDAALGTVFGETRGERVIPLHGGPAGTGVFNMMIPKDPVPGAGWTAMQHGSSWIMTVQFGSGGVRSEGVLTYSQSTDPNSAHYGDQTELFSEKGWAPIHHDLDAARAAAVSVIEVGE
ncbi:MAG: penicillin acylase family protein [Oceanicaulis sp.]